MNKFTSSLLGLFLLSGSLQSYAGTSPYRLAGTSEVRTTTESQVKMDLPSSQNPANWLKSMLNLPSFAELSESGRDGKNGMETIHFRLSLHGIPVENAGYDVVLEGGEPVSYSVNGQLPGNLNDVDASSASINNEAAYRVATELIGAKIYDWGNDPMAGLPLADLVYFSSENSLKLAYKFDVKAAVPESRNWVIVDAQSGSVLHSEANTAPIEEKENDPILMQREKDNPKFSLLSSGCYNCCVQYEYACEDDQLTINPNEYGTVHWYDSRYFTNRFYTGSTYTAEYDIPGTYYFYLTSYRYGYEVYFKNVIVTVTEKSSTPVMTSCPTICFGDATPAMTAQGTNVTWYADANASQAVAYGNNYVPNVSQPGQYVYFASQNANGCESELSACTLTIKNIVPPVDVTDAVTCFGDANPALSADDANALWYADAGLTQLVHTGANFVSSETAVGTYTYYVIREVDGCYCAPSSATLTIKDLPAAPQGTSEVICFGDAIPALTASGQNITWYNGADQIVGSGNSFTPQVSGSGTFSFFATQTVDGCESKAVCITLTIKPDVDNIVAQDASICEGEATPALIADDASAEWYADAGLTQLLFTGSSFTSGETAPGSYTYHVIRRVDGCISDPVPATLTILDTPSTPSDLQAFICYGDDFTGFEVLGDNVRWYADSDMNQLLATGNTFNPNVVNSGSYTYYVSRTSQDGCESPLGIYTLVINPIIPTPVLNNDTICFDGSTGMLTSNSANTLWFSDLNLTNLVFEGANFEPANVNPGVYTYYAINADDNCQSEVASASLVIKDLPAAPATEGAIICFDEKVPALTAQGSNLTWYADQALTSPVGNGNSFVPSVNGAGTYTFYVTQMVEECEGLASEVSLVIKPEVPAVITQNATVCEGNDNPALSADDNNAQWYADEQLSQHIYSGLEYVSPETEPGTYTYYVVRTVDGCVSEPSTVQLVIYPTPDSPETTNATACYGENIPALSSTGNDVKWYSDAALTNLVASGNNFVPNVNNPGIYTYYATATNEHQCESAAAVATLEINNEVVAPQVSSETICNNETVPALTANSANAQWYSDAALTNLVASGASFTPAVSNPGTYNYYVIDVANACESEAAIASLTIKETPAAPQAQSFSICFADPNPTFTVDCESAVWFDNGVEVATGSSFTPAVDQPDTYTYQVQCVIDGCESELADMTLEIKPIVPPVVAQSAIVCEGEPNPALVADDANTEWYLDWALTTLVHVGPEFTPTDSVPGKHTYFVTRTINGCSCAATPVSLTIKPTPVAPEVTSEVICEGVSIPALTANSATAKWYSDAALTNLVAAGINFTPAVTNPGVYTYYVNNEVDGCESDAVVASLTIKETPAAPETQLNTICEGDEVPAFTVDCSSAVWFENGQPIANGEEFTPAVTEPGTYEYEVQCVIDGCESEVATATLVINPRPDMVHAECLHICEGDSIPAFEAEGENITWYADANGTLIVGTGNTFTPDVTGAGAYAFYVSQTVNGCESELSKAVIIIKSTPDAPEVTDAEICYGDIAPALVASVDSAIWYADAELTILVGTGAEFTPADTAVGTYTYYVVYMDEECQSAPAEATLIIKELPAKLTVDCLHICEGEEVPAFEVQGDNITWYADANGTLVVGTGNTFVPDVSAPGTYAFYVSHESNGCESELAKAVIVIIEKPEAPVVDAVQACYGDDNPAFYLAGDSVIWYADAELTTQIAVGNSFQSQETEPGTYNYYATVINDNGCESAPGIATLRIIDTPLALPVSIETICYGDDIPTLYTSGEPAYWYTDAELTNLVSTTDSYTPNVSEIGTYYYYVVYYHEGCQSEVAIASLTINPLPDPVHVDCIHVCEGEEVPAFFVDGVHITWYADAEGTLVLATGDHFQPEVTEPGTYVYYVSETTNGCESELSKAVVVIWDAPEAPVVDSLEICEGEENPHFVLDTTDVKWYADAELTVELASGTSFQPADNAAGVYTYYVTYMNDNGCESAPGTAVLTIHGTPAALTTTSEEICVGDIVPALTASSDDAIWYADAALTQQIATGASYTPAETEIGTYTYYVIYFENGCQSDVAVATLGINDIPLAPNVICFNICEGEDTPPFIAEGENITWYADAGLTEIVATGNTFTPNVSEPGKYTYFVTQNPDGCESMITAATLCIIDTPDAPVADDVVVCEGENVPSLYAEGNQIIWYADAELTTAVALGNEFATGHVAPGVYTYYAVNSSADCQSPATEVTLTIVDKPTVNLGGDITAYMGESIELDAGEGFASYNWQGLPVNRNSNDEESTVEFNTVDLNPGVNTIGVTVADANGCEGSDNIDIDIQDFTTSTPQVDTHDFTVYPNPTVGDLNISLNKSISSDATITVTDTYGRVLTSQILNEGKLQSRIDISQLPQGVYRLTITNGDLTLTKTIVRQ